MRLWMSGEIWHEIAEPFRLAQLEVESAVNKWLAERDYGSGLVELAFIPMVTPAGIGYPSERKSFHRKARKLECRLKLDYSTFAAATSAHQRQLIVRGLLRCVEIARSKRVSAFDADRLIGDLRQFAAECGWAEPPPSHRVT